MPAEQKSELAFLPLQAARSERPGVPGLTDAVLLFLLFFFLSSPSSFLSPHYGNKMLKKTHSENIYDKVSDVVESSKNIYLVSQAKGTTDTKHRVRKLF